jgi:hypothetical protein
VKESGNTLFFGEKTFVLSLHWRREIEREREREIERERERAST